MQKLSVVIITLNAGVHLADCITNIASFADEIVVLDSFSTDTTESIARSFGASFYQRRPKSLIDQMRAAVDLATYDWVFCIDQDERATDELCQTISNLKREGFTKDGYSIKRLNFYLTDWFTRCGWHPDRKIRLFNRNKAYWGGREPHYQLFMKEGTSLEHLNCSLLHYSYRDLSHQIVKMDHFSSLSAEHKLEQGKMSFVRTRMVLDPLYRFIRAYIFEGGFLAGSRGFICSVVQSFYVFSKYAKVWEGMEIRGGKAKVIHPEMKERTEESSVAAAYATKG